MLWSRSQRGQINNRQIGQAGNYKQIDRERILQNFLLWRNKLALVVFGLVWIKGLFCDPHCWLDVMELSWVLFWLRF